MVQMLAASSSFFDIFAAPSLQAILLFVIFFALMNVYEKGRWD